MESNKEFKYTIVLDGNFTDAAGRLEGTLKSDPDVLKAIEVLHDRKLYNEELRIKN